MVLFVSCEGVKSFWKSSQVWYRVIQIVINRDDIQGYAAKTVFEALQSPSCHENMVRVGGYILGEFGNLIAGDPRSRYGYFFQTLVRLLMQQTVILQRTRYDKTFWLNSICLRHSRQLLGLAHSLKSSEKFSWIVPWPLVIFVIQRDRLLLAYTYTV